MPIIVPFPVYGLLFGIQYVAGDVDENFDLDEDIHMVQIALGFFGLSIMWQDRKFFLFITFFAKNLATLFLCRNFIAELKNNINIKI